MLLEGVLWPGMASRSCGHEGLSRLCVALSTRVTPNLVDVQPSKPPGQDQMLTNCYLMLSTTRGFFNWELLSTLPDAHAAKCILR